MRPETILQNVRAVPFRPFRISMNNGKSYEIRHPEFIEVGRDAFLFFHKDQPDGIFRRYEIVSHLLINDFDFLESVSPPPGNGVA